MTKEVFEQNVLALKDSLFRISFGLVPSRFDQEDAVQEAIRIAWQKLPTLKEERYFSTWLIRILIHECYSLLRRKNREIPMEVIACNLPPDGDQEVMEALMALDAKQRLPILLHYVEGYSIKEIARMLRVPESTVKTRMARGRALARDILKEEAPYREKTV